MVDELIGADLELTLLVLVVFGVIYFTVTLPLKALVMELRQIREALYSLELNSLERNIKKTSR